MARIPDRQDYQIAIICALGIESNAIEGIFDEFYDTKDTLWSKADGDRNTYTTGRIGRHYVILAHMPGMGKVNAATTANSIRATFPSITQGLTVVAGVCGGATRTPDGKDIYLGDIIISTDIQQADFGREHPHGFVMRNHLEGNLGLAPVEINSFLRKLQTTRTLESMIGRITRYSTTLLEHLDIEMPSTQSDRLFPTEYLHKHQKDDSLLCNICSKDEADICHTSQKATCIQLGCNSGNVRLRPTTRSVNDLALHFGSVCSTDSVKRNGRTRDELQQRQNVVAFEMEGAGVWNNLPSLIVKAVCDYSDSHKNKRWQEYAAVNAAASCKALIEEWMPKSIGLARRTNPSTEYADPIEVSRWKELHEDVELQKKLASIKEAETQKEYLASLDFEQLDSRFHDINFAYSGTCEWIFKTVEMKSWLNPAHLKRHQGVLWIKGKPGSGKSVLMKHIYQAKQLFLGRTPVAYFFHARGTQLQQSIRGLYRSLLYQLLKADVELLRKFVAEFPARGTKDIKDREWTTSELHHFLLQSVRNGWIKNVVIFIDALDECEHADARELVSFSEDLALVAFERSSDLLICFSIRHFPNISMKRCVEISLESREEHNVDIKQYTRSKIRIKKLVPHILLKAQHVFLWAALVIQILNRLSDTGASFEFMLEQLNSIPTGLHAVFQLLLRDDQGSEEDTLLILVLVLHTCRPLSPYELYEMYVHAKHCLNPSDIPLGHSKSRKDKAIWNSILTASKGLLECKAWQTRFRSKRRFKTTSSYPRKGNSSDSSMSSGDKSLLTRDGAPEARGTPYVQFIHESVGDYLRTITAPEVSHHASMAPPAARCHEIISLSILSALEAFKPFGAHRYNQYAHNHLLDHAIRVCDPGRMKDILRAFALWLAKGTGIPKGGYEDFHIPLVGLIIANRRPSRSSTVSISAPSVPLQALQIAFSDLRDIVKPASWSVPKFSEQSLFYAVSGKWFEGFVALIESGQGVIGQRHIVEGILIRIFECLTIEYDHNELNLRIGFEVLEEPTQEQDAKDREDMESLQNMAKVLLKSSKISDYPLKVSPYNPKDILLKTIAKAYREALRPRRDYAMYDLDNKNALSIAIFYCHVEICELFLLYGTDLGIWNQLGRSPLAMATALGHVDIVHLFLDYGADPNIGCSLVGSSVPKTPSACFDYAELNDTILNLAVSHGHSDIVAVLLIYGADPHRKSVGTRMDAFESFQLRNTYPLTFVKSPTSKESIHSIKQLLWLYQVQGSGGIKQTRPEFDKPRRAPRRKTLQSKGQAWNQREQRFERAKFNYEAK